ncbi:MAG: hypothetical protein P4L64_05850 [Caulobacteraceae bacterium]|nr:hypothetical protein [Caulobacteraceae bacterium]
MTAVLYPIARNAEAALSRPLGRAARASEAQVLTHIPVRFAQEMVGPGFPTREAALDAFPGRLEDERAGKGSVAAEDRFCLLREVTVEPPVRRRELLTLKPVYRDGRRWPTPRRAPQTVWRLSISYWRLVTAEEAESLARTESADAVTAALRARMERPMIPVKPQQPLDVGLFEFRPPEAPHIIMPDE